MRPDREGPVHQEVREERQGRPPLRRLFDLVDGAPDWELEGRCRDQDPTLFFGPNRFEPKRERLAREAAAKAVCAGCPVVVSCREHALGAAELFGVWGGLGEADRRAILVDRGIPIAV